jgi:intracellular sulfur oxidation DsrE/DsrF family protein
MVLISQIKKTSMQKNNSNENAPRRQFLQTIAAGTAALSIAAVMAPFQKISAIPVSKNNNGPDEWFNQLKGKHRMVFDTTAPHGIFPFAWPKVFTLTNAATGTPEKDCSVVVVLRHDAIAYALADSQWAKYKLGEFFKIDDHRTGKRSDRNAFWKPNAGEFKVPGIGPVPIGINELQETGVLFCVCDMAMTVHSAEIAEKMGMAAADVKKEWIDNILPGIQVMPSGVWAVGRAQEHGCTYCFVA